MHVAAAPRRSGYRFLSVLYSAATEAEAGMTAQEWLPGLEDDEEQSEASPSRRRRWLLAGAGALVALVVLAAVGVVGHLIATAPSTRSVATAAPSSAALSTAAATPMEGPVVIEARLTDIPSEGGMEFSPLVVGRQPLQGGSAPDRVPNFGSCTTAPAALQYMPVQIRMPQFGLQGTFTVQTTASTPAGIGRLGFFFQAGDDSTPCPNGAWSASDSFEASNMGQRLITGYVVLDQAFSATTPHGRPDVFRSLQLRVSKIRYGGRRPIVSAPTLGSFCPGTQQELCASLG